MCARVYTCVCWSLLRSNMLYHSLEHAIREKAFGHNIFPLLAQIVQFLYVVDNLLLLECMLLSAHACCHMRGCLPCRDKHIF